MPILKGMVYRFPIALTVSLGAHGILFFYFHRVEHKPDQNPASPVAFEIIEVKGDSTGDGRTKSSGSKAKSGKLLTFKNSFQFGEAKDSASNGRGQGWSDEDFGSGGMVFGNIEDAEAMRRIAEEIEGLLFYPGPLANRRIDGAVNVRLPILKEGGCNQKLIRIYSASNYFRVYILALIKKLCSLPQVEILKLRKAKHLDMNFLFRTVDPSKFESNPRYIISGDTLLFQRHQVKRLMEKSLGPIRISLLYAEIDFPYLFEKWDELTKGTDPLEEFR